MTSYLKPYLVVLARLCSKFVDAFVTSFVVVEISWSVSDCGLSIGPGSSTPSSEESEFSWVEALVLFSTKFDDSNNLKNEYM